MRLKQYDGEQYHASLISTSNTFVTTETATAHASIDLEALRHNVRMLAARSRPAGLMSVVKANGYGHGAIPVARTLLAEGVQWLAVATVAEGVQLRNDGISCRILVMGAMQPAWIDWYVRNDLDATVASKEAAEAMSGSWWEGPPLRVHVKIDTGMGRIGVAPAETLRAVRLLEALPQIDVVGFYTHLASADADDLASARAQVALFDQTLKTVDAAGRIVHIANTEAICRLPESFEGYPNAFVRAGVGLYGSPVRDDTREALDLRQVMTLSAEVTHVKTVQAGTPISYGARWVAERETVIATLGIGYADGYRRILSGSAWAGLNGVRCPIVGTVCMDMIMAAVEPGRVRIEPGSRAVLFGEGGPHVAEVARWAETIPYEIWTGIGARVPRVYANADPAPV